MSISSTAARFVAAMIVAVGICAGALGAAGAAGIPLDDGSPGVMIGDMVNSNTTDQSNSQQQNQNSSQEQVVHQSNNNTLEQVNDIDGRAGGSATSSCHALQGDDGTGADNASCGAGTAVAGDASTGASNQLNSSVQSGSNVNSQTQTVIGGSQVNSPSNVTNQSNTNYLDDIGGDVDKSRDTDLDDNSDDDVTDNKEGELDQSQNNGGIEGNGNSVGLDGATDNSDSVLVGLMTQLLDLLRPLLTHNVSMAP